MDHLPPLPDDRPDQPCTFFAGQVVYAHIINSEVLAGGTPGWIPAVIEQVGIKYPFPPGQGANKFGLFYSINIDTRYLPGWALRGVPIYCGLTLEGDLKPYGRAPTKMLGTWDAIEHTTGWSPSIPPPPRTFETPHS